jgi:hypothetical protein
MLVIAVAVLLLLSPLVARRWPAGLLLHRWRWPWLVWATLALQVVVIEAPMADGLARALHVLTYAAALGFLALNLRLRGAAVVGAGAASNGVTIALNGGVLPASADAVAAAGLDTEGKFANSAVVEDPVLPWLGDDFAWPAPLPLANTFSVGDVLIWVGVGIAAWAGSQRLGHGAHGSPTQSDDGAPTQEAGTPSDELVGPENR